MWSCGQKRRQTESKYCDPISYLRDYRLKILDKASVGILELVKMGRKLPPLILEKRTLWSCIGGSYTLLKIFVSLIFVITLRLCLALNTNCFLTTHLSNTWKNMLVLFRSRSRTSYRRRFCLRTTVVWFQNILRSYHHIISIISIKCRLRVWLPPALFFSFRKQRWLFCVNTRTISEICSRPIKDNAF